MIIPIDDKYRLKTDANQWMVQSKAMKNGKVKWKGVSYQANARQAAASLAERMVRESEAETLADALEDVKRVTDTLTRALTPHVEIV